MSDRPPPLPLPAAIRSRFVDPVNGLRMHVLEAGDPKHPCLVLLHGFPELAFSWREVMPGLAAAVYYVLAPAQRGFGRTTGWDDRYDGDLASFRQLNLVTDVLALLAALDIPRVAALVGHDFGSVTAAWASLIRPDVFPAVVLMSAPFAGPPAIAARPASAGGFDAALAALDPPRRHYTHFFGLPPANADMMQAPEGLAAFLRAYFHVKSGAFAGNTPFALGSATPEAFARLPRYYVMDRDKGMAETVAANRAVAKRDRRMRVDAGRGPRGLRRRVRPHRFPRGSKLVPRGCGPGPEAVFRPDHRRARGLHRRRARLGGAPVTRRLRGNGRAGLYAPCVVRPDRGRRPLGTAGRAGARPLATSWPLTIGVDLGH